MGRTTKPSPLPDNAIEPSPARPEPTANSGQDRRDDRAQNSAIRAAESERSSADSRKRGAASAVQAAPPRDTTTVPDSVRDRFLPIRDKWYFENGDLAFQDHGTKLTTKSENHEIIRSFVAIAKTRGWEEINVVDGTKEFRRAIWHEASLQNIPVRGYTPTEIDEARLVDQIGDRDVLAQRDIVVNGVVEQNVLVGHEQYLVAHLLFVVEFLVARIDQDVP